MPDDVGLIVVRTYQTVMDAELAKTALDSVGIDSTIRSDNKGETISGSLGCPRSRTSRETD